MGDLANWVGIAVQTLAIVATMAGFLMRINTDVKVLVQRLVQMEQHIDNLNSKTEKLSSVIVDIAKQDQRILNLETRVQELSSRFYRRDASE